ncbi:MAG: chorismate synthase [Euryarchaeota archaeon]|nr:chorismate synthase [Euryarchaeota archaeon]MDE1837109.1 chorismate synthase [Euryarchaeota archaeon]MDE1879679.1 chorismate synthase [Euryarchaeota archaeon]MDE2045205.1 chorismate synthase [Thermoplasmata archaeon]
MRMAIGEALRLTLFGSSHGPVVGAVLEGLPAGTPVDLEAVQRELDRRRPIGRALATKRREEDQLRVESGLVNGRTTGDPLVGVVENRDVRRGPYRELEDVPRPGHADFPARMRYGEAFDLSGGGIFSGRMTVGLVFGGAVARGLLSPQGIDVLAFTRSLGGVDASAASLERRLPELRADVLSHEVGCPDLSASKRMSEAIERARKDGDSVGGVIEVRAEGLPVGVGEPFFDSVESTLAHALFSVPAVKGVEFGAGFTAARMRGSEHNDPFFVEDGRVRSRTNHAGGILGGLTTGMPLVARVVVKPTSSIAKEQESVSLSTKSSRRLVVKGRHDPCIVPRAVPVVENLTAFVLADLMARGGFL